jgi:hypothetical protein
MFDDFTKGRAERIEGYDGLPQIGISQGLWVKQTA